MNNHARLLHCCKNKDCNKLRQTLSLATKIKSVTWSESISYTEISGRKEGFQSCHFYENDTDLRSTLMEQTGIQVQAVIFGNFNEVIDIFSEFLQPRLSLGQTRKKKLHLIFRVRFFPYKTNKQAFQTVSKDMADNWLTKNGWQLTRTTLQYIFQKKKRRYWIWNSCPYELLTRASLKKESLSSQNRYHRKKNLHQGKTFYREWSSALIIKPISYQLRPLPAHFPCCML